MSIVQHKHGDRPANERQTGAGGGCDDKGSSENIGLRSKNHAIGVVRFYSLQAIEGDGRECTQTNIAPF